MPLRTELISSFQDIAARYPCIFCDIWGVMHNGATPYAQMGEHLTEYRKSGGFVALISNAPRPWNSVQEGLDIIGVSRNAYDIVITSGDLGIRELQKREGKKLFYIGTHHNKHFLPDSVQQTDITDADFIYCTALWDHDQKAETIDAYKDLLEAALSRSLTFICANPDLVAEDGDRIVMCAGSIAQAYEEMGGNVFWAGKPYEPIYTLAQERAEKRSTTTFSKKDILAIGDAIRTDIAGAVNFGIDSLMVTTGIHADIFRQPEPDFSSKWLSKQAVQPTYLYQL